MWLAVCEGVAATTVRDAEVGIVHCVCLKCDVSTLANAEMHEPHLHSLQLRGTGAVCMGLCVRFPSGACSALLAEKARKGRCSRAGLHDDSASRRQHVIFWGSFGTLYVRDRRCQGQRSKTFGSSFRSALAF